MAEQPKSYPAKTATDQTIQHYQDPRVRRTIIRFVEEEFGWRALNGDQGWYKTKGNGEVRLRSSDDYEDTISRYRSLYITLDLLDPSVKKISRQWDKSKKAPVEPIGTLGDCLAYTLGADIDSIAPQGLDILSSKEIELAVEDAARYLVSRLRIAGISKSVHCLYSGGGIYVLIHHELFRAKPDWTSDDRQHGFHSLTRAFNMWLADVEKDFFRLHPEHKGKVKIDKINNQKRKFKCIFSIHKKHDLAVIPLDPDNINIDFDRAKLPLSADVLAEGENWYKDFDVEEKEALKDILAPYVQLAKDDLQQLEERTDSYDISRRSEPLAIESWPPCMRNILKAELGRGPHRACAVLAAYLYQVGWSEEEARNVWNPVADRCSVEDRIFEQWFGEMICPNCATLQETSSGYPKTGLGGLGYCLPDENCGGCKWPGGYNRWSPEELKKRLKGNLSELTNPEILKALSDLRQSDQLEFSLLIKDAKITGEVKKALERKINQIQRNNLKKVASPEIQASAVEILKSGDPMKYIADCCGRMVLGAEKAFKKLICCISVQNVQQSAGLHPKLSGESGGGKTWVLMTFAHHLPDEAVVKGSMSAKAGYYHKDGDRIFRILDDYQEGNDDLDTVIKQTSSTFHEPYTHRTVANNKALTLQIGAEQTWAITSVDSSQDIQVLNRQIPINVDDSEELTRKVNNRTVERYGEGEPQFPVDDTILICREIFRILRDEGYINVKVPFHDRIEWIDTSNRRNTSIFMDLLIAHTAMYRNQREKDEDGYYLAAEEDFAAAKDLFVERDAEELVRRLSKRERQFAELLMRHKEGLVREDVAKEMKLSPTRISHLANGDKGQGGLSQKLPGFCAQEITDYEDKYGNKRAVRKTLYKLEGYNPLEGFDAVVKLRDGAHDADGVRHEAHTESSAEINNSEREKREINIESADSAEKKSAHSQSSEQSLDEKNPISHKSENFPHSNKETASIGSVRCRTTRRIDAHSAHIGATDSGALSSHRDSERGIGAELQLADRRIKDREEHFKTPGNNKKAANNSVAKSAA